jgi:hypothetical protein
VTGTSPGPTGRGPAVWACLGFNFRRVRDGGGETADAGRLQEVAAADTELLAFFSIVVFRSHDVPSGAYGK